jgi:hypothetical protein
VPNSGPGQTPRKPKGNERPAFYKIAPGEIYKTIDDGKDAAAMALGCMAEKVVNYRKSNKKPLGAKVLVISIFLTYK